ncbi:MAG: class C sortase, partial [Propionibacteriaceae bacterium]|nr:class C sortase [Propionibacteriaceae bacterium]
MTATLDRPPRRRRGMAPRQEPIARRPVAEAPTKRRLRFFPILLVLAGILVLLYPVAATQYNNQIQQEMAHKYRNDVQAAAPADLSAELADAQAYNDSLHGGIPILDPWLLDVARDPGSDEYKRYASQLDVFDVMARVKVPSVGIDLPVRHGTDEDAIANGAGHLYGTSLPIGGLGTHSVLTSHTGMPNATLFDPLIDVKEGDLLLVEVLGETLAYEVDQIKIVLPNEISDLSSEPGHDYLTVFTCTPYAVNTHRLLVRGERVPYTPEIQQISEESDSGIQMQPWMW